MKNAIAVRNLTKHYEDVTAVDHISFEVGRAKFSVFSDQTGLAKQL
ncbi:MAG: hypothetical protein QW612_06240 [Candidatus Bathyarchaeia archaeon]